MIYPTTAELNPFKVYVSCQKLNGGKIAFEAMQTQTQKMWFEMHFVCILNKHFRLLSACFWIITLTNLLLGKWTQSRMVPSCFVITSCTPCSGRVNVFRYHSTYYIPLTTFSFYEHNMMTSSNGNIFRVTGPLCGEFTGPGEFPTQRPVTRSFDVFFDLRLNKRLSKHSWGWWFETLSWSLWRHHNELWVRDEKHVATYTVCSDALVVLGGVSKTCMSS